MSKLTFWPSLRVRMPAASTAETCPTTSLPPPSGEMKPKPLLELKNFTVPMVMIVPLNHRVPSTHHAGTVAEKNIGSGEVFGSSGTHLRVRKTEALRLTGTQEPRTGHLNVYCLSCNESAKIKRKNRSFFSGRGKSIVANRLPLHRKTRPC